MTAVIIHASSPPSSYIFIQPITSASQHTLRLIPYTVKLCKSQLLPLIIKYLQPSLINGCEHFSHILPLYKSWHMSPLNSNGECKQTFQLHFYLVLVSRVAVQEIVQEIQYIHERWDTSNIARHELRTHVDDLCHKMPTFTPRCFPPAEHIYILPCQPRFYSRIQVSLSKCGAFTSSVRQELTGLFMSSSVPTTSTYKPSHPT